jgi:hypothetical protein
MIPHLPIVCTVGPDWNHFRNYLQKHRKRSAYAYETPSAADHNRRNAPLLPEARLSFLIAKLHAARGTSAVWAFRVNLTQATVHERPDGPSSNAVSGQLSRLRSSADIPGCLRASFPIYTPTNGRATKPAGTITDASSFQRQRKYVNVPSNIARHYNATVQ